MKQILKITLIAIASLIILYGAFAVYVKVNNPNPLFMDYRYNKVITTPLARIGLTDAQYKMGLFWFYGNGESEPTKTEIENAVSWWEKASEKGNNNAEMELTKAKELLDELNNPLQIEFEGYDYEHGVMYYNRAVKYISEDNDADALDCTMKALVILERLGLQEDSLYNDCVGLIPAIEEIAERKYTTS